MAMIATAAIVTIAGALALLAGIVCGFVACLWVLVRLIADSTGA